MAKIKLENIKKKFGKITALDGVSLEVRNKEFFVLFGPAGAGKTTILNCIAGIMLPEEGTIAFDDQVVNLVDAAHRNTAMVFENYALYPQMTVYDNMASPLRSKLYKESEDVIRERVEKAARMMKMENLLERLPSQLSNGQKQRVAMGRALVRTPNVFLMDEPLAHLDAKLRNAMRTELKEMQRDFGTTSIYVTHDFMEAMSLGDRIAIINQGKIVQLGTPDDVYYMPVNEFVAQLMGDPEINMVSGTCSFENGKCRFTMKGTEESYILPEDGELLARLQSYNGRACDMAIRPQNVKYSFEALPGHIEGSVYSYESIGNKAVIEADCGGVRFRMIAPNGISIKIDQKIWLKLQLDHTIFFDGETKNYIGRYNEAEFRALSAEAQHSAGQEEK